MDVKELKRLLESVKDSDISELVLETGDYKLSVKRGSAEQTYAQQTYAPPPAGPPTPAPQTSAPPATPTELPSEPAAPAPTPASTPISDLVEVTAPIVGTFYAAPGPDAPDFVKVGDRVQAGAVLCIIEAMKLMNEIEADTSGTVREILVRDTEPVEYGQALFRLESS